MMGDEMIWVGTTLRYPHLPADEVLISGGLLAGFSSGQVVCVGPDIGSVIVTAVAPTRCWARLLIGPHPIPADLACYVSAESVGAMHHRAQQYVNDDDPFASRTRRELGEVCL